MPRTRNSKSPLFQRRHYEAIANLIRGNPDIWSYAAFTDLVLMLERDNVKFDKAKFKAVSLVRCQY